jgi:DNA-binding transcriptional MerR regulator
MDKLYYSISEVSQMLGITLSNLRFWEKEFKQLKPRRNPQGTRFYTNEDITLLKQIIYLVNDQNLTLEGARQRLSQKKDQITKQHELVERLKRIKMELRGLSKALTPDQK